MNFLHLRYFLTVAEEMNITRAAERLYISQQSLSNHISNLEKELDTKLFTRSPKLSLTYSGALLVETASQMVDLQQQYQNKVGDINRNYLGSLRVGISYTCGLTLLPDILPRFRAEFPLVEFSLFEGNSSELEQELSHGRVDIIIGFQPIMMEGVEIVPLIDDRLILVVPAPFTDQIFGERAEQMREEFSTNVDITAFSELPFVLLKKGNRARGIAEQYLNSCKFKPHIALETENTVTTLALAKAAVGIVICPELFLRAVPLEHVDLFPLTSPGTISRLALAYRRDRYLSHFGERFIAITQDVLKQRPSF